MTNIRDFQTWRLGKDGTLVEARLQLWQADAVGNRLWRRDPTLWPQAPVSDVESRMGWLDLPAMMHDQLSRLTEFAEEVRAEGTRHVVVLGMGGSSLAPDVFGRAFGNRRGYPELLVLDSTHPEAVRAVSERVDPATTVFLVSSKSGTTLEPLSFHRFFWEAARSAGVRPERHFVAVTDPGTPLESLAVRQGFRAIFRALPTVGGRYSALTVFGLVPAALIGVDVRRLLDAAVTMAEACGPAVPAPDNPGLGLGAALGELAIHGRDKVTFLASSDLAPFPMWAEQLIAESTGKIGKGMIPVVDEPVAPADRYGADRLFVVLQGREEPDAALTDRVAALEASGHPVIRLRVPELTDLGQEFFRWELAVASSGMILGIDPYDQPDVELAKELARKAMADRAAASTPSDVVTVSAADPQQLSAHLKAWRASYLEGTYIGIQAYLCPRPETLAGLQRIRRVFLDRLRAVTTLGYGPRFLHSTGQLHKGGPSTALFLQLVDEPRRDLEIPGAGYTFGQLIRAQALGDYQALQQKHRQVLRIDLGPNDAAGLQSLLRALDG